MVSKKVQKQRARKKRLREQQRDPLIGYYAHNGPDAVCDNGGLVIAGSQDAMRLILEVRLKGRLGDSSSNSIRRATFCEIQRGIRRGGAYCFDETAYGRFLAPANKAGMNLSQEDFSDPGPLAMTQCRGVLGVRAGVEKTTATALSVTHNGHTRRGLRHPRSLLCGVVSSSRLHQG